MDKSILHRYANGGVDGSFYEPTRGLCAPSLLGAGKGKVVLLTVCWKLSQYIKLLIRYFIIYIYILFFLKIKRQ